MKRLNKTQKEIEELAKKVPQLTNAQKEWAIKHFNYFCVIDKKEKSVVCPNCHSKLSTKENKKKGSKWCKTDHVITCPHCGAKIQLREIGGYGRHERYHQEDFVQILNVIGDWQVTRLIYMDRYCYKRKENTDWAFYEVCQAWNNPAHKKTFFRAFPKTIMIAGRPFNPYAIHTWRYECTNVDNWTYNKYTDGVNELEPRMAGSANYFDTTAIVPGGKILPAFRKLGINSLALRSISHNAMWLFESVSQGNYTPMYETMLKGGDYKVFEQVTNDRHERNADAYFTALKICKRNKYDYKKNATEWLDIVKLLIELEMDYHSPHYVCPADIHEMHQRLLNAKRRREDLDELKKNMTQNKEYKKRVARFLDMDIHDGNLQIVVLPNVQSFKEEADHLCHCVYSCRYYTKKDSLILSARDKKGKRWETIEVSLKTFKILQSYGYADSHTTRHKEITNLVNRNMWQIRERSRMVC